MTYFITAFYHFTQLTDLSLIQSEFEAKAKELEMTGLLILGPEGVNSTCALKNRNLLNEFKNWIRMRFENSEIRFKDSTSEYAPFRRYKVKVRDEIVTTGIPGVLPPPGKNQHLTPAEWNRVLKEEEDFVLIDTRNWYEYQVGTFKGALNPNIEKFTEFPAYIEQQGISKDKKMLIFCTGGIRCEKGILELQRQGYQNVFQLEGGILNYLEQFPSDQFEGECFVFDHRVAVDQNLRPSHRYTLCPHCGQPGETQIVCVRCDHPERICSICAQTYTRRETCSKNCANQWQLRPGQKGPHQWAPYELERPNRRPSSEPGPV